MLLSALALAFALTATAQEPPAVFAPLEPPVLTNYTLLPAAKHKVGNVHRMVLMPWEEKVAQDPAIEKVRLLDDVVNYEADLFWVEERGPGR